MAWFTLFGKRYELAERYTLRDMCDAEFHFHVVFDDEAPANARDTAARLWISVRRVDPDTRPDVILDLDEDEQVRIAEEIDASRRAEGEPDPEPVDPLASTRSSNGSSGTSSDESSDTRETLQATGVRGSDTGSPE